MIVLDKYQSPPGVVGIDKLNLFTNDYQIKDPLHLNITPHTKKSGEDAPSKNVLFRVGDNPVIAQKAYLNTEGYNLSINDMGLSLNLNPSKHFHDYQLVFDLKQVDQAVKQVEKELFDLGIGMAIENSKISRLDLAKQFVTNQTVPEYMPVLSMFKGKRSNTIEFPSSVSYRNKSIESMCYDKGLELQRDSKPSHFMRAEIRYKTGKSMSTHIKRNSYSEIIKTDPEFLNQKYIEHWRSNVFRIQPAIQLTLDLDNHIAMLKMYKRRFKRGAIDKFLQVISLDAILSTYKDFEVFRRVLLEAEFSREYSYRYVQKLHMLMADKAKFEKENDQVTNITMYNEILEKISA